MAKGMLYQYGSITFEVWPINTHEVGRNSASTFVEKPVIGRRPPLEFVGAGADTVTMKGRLFPINWGGSMEVFYGQQSSGKAFPLMRGDGKALGFYVCETVEETAQFLDYKGRGRMIEFTLTLKRSDAASGSRGGERDLFRLIAGLFQ